jgi:hypothetical protein
MYVAFAFYFQLIAHGISLLVKSLKDVYVTGKV